MFMFPIRQNATVCDPEKLPRFTLETHPSEPAAQSTLLSWAVWQRCMNLPSSSQPSCGCISLRKVLLCWCTWQCNIGVDDAVAWTVARAALLTWGHTYAPRGPATGKLRWKATSTACWMLQLMHTLSVTPSWVWMCHKQWKCPAEIMARIVASSEMSHCKNTSPFFSPVNASQGRRDSGCLSNLVIYSLYIWWNINLLISKRQSNKTQKEWRTGPLCREQKSSKIKVK